MKTSYVENELKHYYEFVEAAENFESMHRMVDRLPIIPVMQVQSYKYYNSRHLTPVKTQVHFLKPIPSSEYVDLNTTQISDMVKERIANKISELR